MLQAKAAMEFFPFVLVIRVGTSGNYVITIAASDLDSIVSSITYSYALTKQGNRTTIPIINIPRDEYNLRTDAFWFLDKFGIGADDLIFYHQNQYLQGVLSEQANSNSLYVVLVDHNKLAPEQEGLLGRFVNEILDHHIDEKCYSVASDKKVVELIGSTCTLVSEKMSDEFLKNERQLTEALLGTILLDTMNLEPQYKKVTPKDEQQAKRLIVILGYTKKEQDELFDKLFYERFNVSNLTSQDLLRSDYKEWKMGSLLVGIATAKRSLEEWFDKERDIIREFQQFYKSKQLDVLYVMCAFSDEQNNFKRQLVVFTSNKDVFSKAVTYLEGCKEELNLVPCHADLSQKFSTKDYKVYFFNQFNIASSRKQIQPLLVKHHSE